MRKMYIYRDNLIDGDGHSVQGREISGHFETSVGGVCVYGTYSRQYPDSQIELQVNVSNLNSDNYINCTEIMSERLETYLRDMISEAV